MARFANRAGAARETDGLDFCGLERLTGLAAGRDRAALLEAEVVVGRAAFAFLTRPGAVRRCFAMGRVRGKTT
jgi:hypothetical protein